MPSHTDVAATRVATVSLLQYEAIAAEIDGIPGVITHGLLLNVADTVLLASADGSVRVLEQKQAAAAAPSS